MFCIADLARAANATKELEAFLAWNKQGLTVKPKGRMDDPNAPRIVILRTEDGRTLLEQFSLNFGDMSESEQVNFLIAHMEESFRRYGRPAAVVLADGPRAGHVDEWDSLYYYQALPASNGDWDIYMWNPVRSAIGRNVCTWCRTVPEEEFKRYCAGTMGLVYHIGKVRDSGAGSA